MVKDIFSQIGRDFNKIQRRNTKTLKKINKDNTKKLKQLTSIHIKSLIAKEGRVRIPAKRKHQVEEKYNNRCADCKKTSSQLGVKLQFHHKNMKNSNNGLNNLELLCPNHHFAKHGKGKNPKRKSRSSLFSF